MCTSSRRTRAAATTALRPRPGPAEGAVGEPGHRYGGASEPLCVEVRASGTPGIPAGLQLGARKAEVACDQDALDLARSLADLENLGVAVEPRDRELLH